MSKTCEYCKRDAIEHNNINETPMVELYWRKEPRRTLIEEFGIRTTGDCEPRWIDGIILKQKSIELDGVKRDYWYWPDLSQAQKDERDQDLKGKKVIVVQAKASQIGFCVMGLALFSRYLVEKRGMEVIDSI